MADNLILIAVKADDQASGPLNQIATGALRGLGDAAVRMAGDAVQALAGFTVSSITAAGNFEQSLNVLQAASGATSGQMDRMRALAVALGNDMALPGASAQDAATAMLELSKAGLTVDQAMAAATGTLQLAAAAETDASTAASIVAGALNAFHLEGTAAAQVADQLAAGANASAASITDLAAGFQQAGFAFDATGQHTDDLITSLSMLTNVGLTGTDAGTALKNAMMQLMAPTSAAASTMQQYGINVRDAQGTMLPFRDIIGVLQTQLGGLSAAQREAALKTILQGDGMKAMLPLISAGVAGFDAMQAKVNQSGAAQAMAAAQMQGFNGALAGAANAVETLQLTLGGALLPILTSLLNTAISPAINGLSTFASALFGSADAFAQLGPVAQFAVSALQAVGAIFVSLGTEAAAWGANIVNQLASGMAAAAQAVVSVLMDLGALITDWLVPHSPPKLLPNLDQWGADAATIYMEGWSNGDFSVFNAIGDTIKGALEGIAKATGNKNLNVASMVLGSQDDIARAIDEIHNLGGVSEETFGAIIAAAGPAGPQIGGVVRAYLDLEAATQDVARAQEALNSVTAEYTAKLDPLNAQLKGLQGQKQALQDQARLAELNKTLADDSADANKKALAALEIQEIQVRQNIRAAEQERDTAVGAAKAKLDAAKDQQAAAQAQVDRQKALADAQNKTNALIAEQSRAIAGAAGAMKGAASAISAHALAQTSATGPIAAVSNALDTASSAYHATSGAAAQAAQTVATTVSPAFSALQTAVAPIGVLITANMDAIRGAISGIAAAAAGLFAVLVVGPAIWGMLGSAIGAVTVALGALLSPIGLMLIAAAALGAAISTNFMGIGALAQNLIGILGQFGAVVTQAFAAFQSGGLSAALATFSTGLTSVWASLQVWGAQLGTVLLAIGQTIAAQVLTWGTAFIGWIAPYIPIVLAALGGFAASVWGWIAAQAPVLLGMIAGWGQSLVAWIGPAIPPALAALGGLASSVFAWVSAQAAPLLTQFGVWAQALVTWIVPATVQFLSAWPGMLSSFLDWIASAAGPILAQLGTWAIQFVSWIVPMIPSFLVGLGGVAVALATFIAETAVVIASRVVMWATSLLGWVATNVLPALPGILGDILSSILGWIGTAASAIGNVALDIGKSLVDGFIKGITGGAASVIDAAKNLARSAYDAAMGALQAHSPSRLFTKVGGTVPAGMSVGITAGMPAVESNLINGIAGLSEKAATALDAGAKAIAAAASYSGPGGSGLSGFLASFAELATQFNATAIALGGRILGTANRFADAIGKVAGAIGPAVEGLQALSGFVAPSQAAMQAFTDGFARVLTMLYAVAQQFADGSFKASTTFAESAGALIAVIEPAVTGFEALSTFVRPVPGLIQTFTDVLAWLVARFIAAGRWLQGPGLSAAVTFADAAGTITGILGTAVEGFGALAAFAKPAPGLIQAFTDVVAWLVARFALAGTWLQSQGMPAAVAFADAAAAIVGLVAPAITGFTQLATFVRPVPGLIQTFTDVVAWLVARFIAAGTWLQSQGLAAAVAFADAAGTIIGLIGGGVEAFAKLATFQAIPQSAILAFGQALQGTIALLMTVAHTWEQGAVEAVAVFSEAAATAIGVIGAGVDGFVKLADFEGVPEAAIAAFGDALDRALQALVVLAGQFAVEAVAAAAAFGEGVGRAIGFIGGAVDSFAKLADVGRLSQDAVNAFSFNIVLVVAQLQQLAQVFTADALTAVGVFAAAVTQAIAGLGGAGDSLMQLAESKRLDPDAVNAWSFNVVLVVAQLQQLAQVFSTDALTAAGQFAAGVVSVVTSVKSALETIASLANAPQLQGEVLGAFLDAAQVLLTQMASYLPPNANSIGQNTIIGLITGILAQRANLITAMVSTVLAAVAAAQQTLGIASPSTVFDEMGMQSGQGYVQGLEGQQSPVVAASAGLAQAATTAALPTLRGTPTAAGPTSNARSVTIQVAPGAIVIHGAPGQRETAMADAALARLTQLTRMAATG